MSESRLWVMGNLLNFSIHQTGVSGYRGEVYLVTGWDGRYGVLSTVLRGVFKFSESYFESMEFQK